MADIKKQIEKWNQRIDKAKKIRKEFEKEWDENYKIAFGDLILKDGKVSIRDDSTGKSYETYKMDLIASYLRTEIPSLILYRPEVFLNARPTAEMNVKDAQQQAKKIESHVNTVLADIDGLEIELKCAIETAELAIGIAKTVFVSKFVPNPNAGKQKYDQYEGFPLYDPETNQPILEPDVILDSISFDISSVNPYKFLIDDKCKNNPKKAKWMGEEIEGKTLEDIIDAGVYSKKVIDNLREKRNKNGELEDWEIDVKFYEIYDIRNNKLIAICDEYDDDYLRNETTPDGIEGHPYSILKFGLEIPGQFYNKPEISSGRQMQEEYELGREWQKQNAKKSRPLMGYKDNVDEAELKKLQDGTSDLIKLVNQGDVFQIPIDMKTPDAQIEHMNLLMKDFDQAMSQSSQDRGLVGEAKFATEAQIAETQGKIRDSEKIAQVKVFNADIIEKLLKLMKANYDDDFQVPVSLKKGWDTLSKTELNLDVDIEIDIESKTSKNKAIERKQLIELGNVYPQLFSSDTFIDQILRSYDLKERDKIITEIKEVKPQPNVPKLGITFQPKWEFLTEEAQNAILDLAFRTNIPMPADQQTEPKTGESVEAGTEGMEVGSGLMPSGETL